MDIRASRRLEALSGYAFDELDRRIAELREQGVAVTDFGVGDPTTPTPELVRRATQAAVDTYASAGYPSYVGSAAYRKAVSEWMERRFGLRLDPTREICSTIGSKEAVFHFAEAFVDPGDLVLVPSPGYPPYSRGTLFAEGRSYFYPLDAENGFLPDLDALPAEVVRAARVLWICYPNAPTGRVATRDELARIVDFAARNDIVLASDEAYGELWFDGPPPPSALEVARDGVVAFYSLSKRSAMTGYRVGWVAGDERIVALFKKVKTNIDSGTPDFVQAGAIAALSDEAHVERMRSEYKAKRDLIVDAFATAGCPRCVPTGSIYVWQRAPEGMDGLELARRLLEEDVAVATMPGAWLAEPLADGRNPGERYIRLALVPNLEETRAAAGRIAALRLP